MVLSSCQAIRNTDCERQFEKEKEIQNRATAVARATAEAAVFRRRNSFSGIPRRLRRGGKPAVIAALLVYYFWQFLLPPGIDGLVVVAAAASALGFGGDISRAPDNWKHNSTDSTAMQRLFAPSKRGCVNPGSRAISRGVIGMRTAVLSSFQDVRVRRQSIVRVRGGGFCRNAGALSATAATYRSSLKPLPPFALSSSSVPEEGTDTTVDKFFDGDHDTHTQHQHQPPAPPSELSSLAKSIRDRVAYLVDTAACTTRSVAAVNRIGCGGNENTTIDLSASSQKVITLMTIPIVVAVSGGCDSVALLHALFEWKDHLEKQQQDDSNHHHTYRGQQQQQQQPKRKSLPILELDITVVHFHHRQRPIDADKDCQLVRDLVESYNEKMPAKTNVTFHLEDWRDRIDRVATSKDITTTTTTTGANSFSQERARSWRREKLRDRAKERLASLRSHSKNTKNKIPFGIVLTAHHDDDSYETVLIKLLRGVHLLNLHDRATIASIALMENVCDGDSDGDHGDATEGRKRMEEEEEEAAATESKIFLVRPFVASSRSQHKWGGHTKDDLIDYLQERKLEWREDASNHDPNSKYLRNRVRNELVPLLKDLTEDSFRTKRIPALLEQSFELSEDIAPRVDVYCKTAIIPATSETAIAAAEHQNPTFKILPDSESNGSRVVRSQALYRWMNECVQQQQQHPEGNGDNTISNESLQRVVQQMEDYPERKRWTLEVGSGWNVCRLGEILAMAREAAAGDAPIAGPRTRGAASIKFCSWIWNRSEGQEQMPTNNNIDIECSDSLQIRVPSTWLGEDPSSSNSENRFSLEFVSTTLQEAEARQQEQTDSKSQTAKASSTSFRFLPPWRNSPLKLRSFLRGQKIPVHLRESTPLLFARTTGLSGEPTTSKLIAVSVHGKWIVNKEFHPEQNDKDVDGMAASDDAILLTLERRTAQP